MEPSSTPDPQISSPRGGAGPRFAVHLEVAARSDPGLERSGNEDSFLVVSRPGWAVLAVCDGMGGAAAGEVASRTAVEVIREVVTAGGSPETRDAAGRRLLHSVEEAARRVFAASSASRALAGMGTTATACALIDDVLYMGQVGDSRAYLLRDGHFTQLTRDQTLASVMLARGEITADQLVDFPYGHVILQAVGTTERVDVDLTRVRVAQGDVILVCSDGLYGPLEHEAIAAVLAREPTPAGACEALIALANEAGGPDNITVIVGHVSGDALQAPSGPPLPEKARLDEDATVQVERSAAANEPAAAAPPQSEAEEGVLARLAAIFRRRRERSA